jgi:hypothetical protein
MQEQMISADDERQLLERGIPLKEALRQLELFARPPQFVKLERACTVGDGIERIAEEAFSELLDLHAEAVQSGRFTRCVPASGAATRMFKNLLHFQRGPGREDSWDTILKQAREGQGQATALVEVLREMARLPFRDGLQKTLFRRGEDLQGLAGVGAFQPILDGLLGSEGLDLDERPKGLIPFHAYPEGSRTAFEEHLVEAAAYTRDKDGLCRLHFTVSPEHRAGFEELFGRLEQSLFRRLDARYEIGFSVQKPETDTLAADESGRPLHDPQGRLRLRPGGHGSLIENLNDLGADLVFVKNIDNVQPDRLRSATVQWKKLLAGYLVGLQRDAFAHLGRLREAAPTEEIIAEAEAFVRRRLNIDLDGRVEPSSYQARRASLIGHLNRPLRVCGVVPNTGEPGGGPFWVLRNDGTPSRQIVETAQVDAASEEQQQLLRSSTHFNPVDLVCAVRDAEGRPYDLREFIDHDAVIITRKSVDGRAVRALERPGLWNGSMAGWNTVFVEVPLETFTPVKTVLDLLRPEHQG